MRAAQLVSPGTYEFVETDIPQPADDEILVRMKACGVCMSEMGSWIGKGHDPYPMPAGMTGHEPYGVVAGGACEEFPLGTLVTAVMDNAAAYAEYVTVKKAASAAVPEKYQDRIVLGEPLACAVNAVKRGRVIPGDSAAVIGAGYMGLLLLSVLRTTSLAPIVVFDLKEENRQLALAAGADIAVDPADESAVKKAAGEVGGNGFDNVYEAAGAQSAIDLAADLLKTKGNLFIYGYHSINKRTIDMQIWNYKAINVINAHERDLMEYADGMKRGLKLFRYRRDLPDYITHRVPFKNIHDALQMMVERPKGYIKGVIVFD